MWSEEREGDIIDGDHDGHGGHDDTSEDLSTPHCAEGGEISPHKFCFSGGECISWTGQVPCPTWLPRANWFHTAVRPSVRPICHGLFHLRALLGDRNDDDDDDDSQKKRSQMR